MTSSEHLIPGNHKHELHSDAEENHKHNGAIDSEATSLDDRMDVQVLVSSKRRSILRVVNPDAQSMHETISDQSNVIREDYDSGEAFSQVLDNHFERILNESDAEENEVGNKLLRQRVISGQSEPIKAAVPNFFWFICFPSYIYTRFDRFFSLFV